MATLISRKEFLKTLGLGAPALLCTPQAYGFFSKRERTTKSIKGHIFRNDAPPKPWKWSIEAFHYATDGTKVQCQICPNRCILAPGDRSICRSRVNIGGKLYSLAYGNPCSINVDPIEKKPLFHFYPGTSIFSIATAGCNFRCLNCRKVLVERRGYALSKFNIENGLCKFCKTSIPGRWEIKQAKGAETQNLLG